MNIFVGNLSFSATSNDVKALFEVYGKVDSVTIKKKSGQNSRGFGFVRMSDDQQAEAAIKALENKEFMGRPLNISIERPKAPKPKKDYKEIKRQRQEARNNRAVEFVAPVIAEKSPAAVDRPSPKTPRKSPKPSTEQSWEKRKGRGTAKPWKKKPGGVNKKFKYAR